jgi:acyl-CoA hydrolase
MLNKKLHYLSAEEVVSHIQSGQRVFLHGSAATPVALVNALINRTDLENVELVSISTYGIDLNKDILEGRFYINSLFVSESTRVAINSDRGDYIPVFLSEIPKLFTKNILPLDVALLHVSPPDKHGFCSLGTSVDVARAAMQSANLVIAQVNPNMPRMHGDAFIPAWMIDYAVWVEDPLPEVSYAKDFNDVYDRIGKNVAELVEDAATLQLGIGNLPDAVLKNLGHLKDLGLHTEMFSDGVIPLIENGIINNSRKNIIKDYCVTGFVLGTKKLYDFIDDNPLIKGLDISYVNNPHVISRNPKVTAINSAIEIDLTGQVCSDSIGAYQYSGIGGQMDFMRGAALSEGGKPIIAIPSTTKKGESRIVTYLKKGAGVVTTRGHIHWVVTEYGKVNLYGLNMEQRGKALISIAHPDHREQLSKEFTTRFNL